MGVDGAVDGMKGARDGRRGVDGAGEGREGSETEGASGLWKWNEAWRGPMLLHASRQNVVVRMERSCAADMLVTRTWLRRKHHCRLLRVSS